VNYFLGIDIGTTHTKAVVSTDDGKPFFESKRGYELLQPQPGYEELDVEVIMDAVVTVTREALQNIPEQDTVGGVGFSAAMHSLFPVDINGKPLYNAITWADIRSKKEAWQILQHPSSRAVYNNTGIPIHPMSPLCKIVWFRNQRPDIFALTHKFISIKEYVFLKMFGKYVVDYSIASATGLFNIRERKWDETAMDIAGITEAQLSSPVSTTHAEYELLPAVSKMFGGRERIPFVIGASDGCLANLGSGAIMHGDTALTIGTSGAVRMTVYEPMEAGEDRLFTYLLADNIYVRGGAINNGGIVLKWLAELFLWKDEGKENDYDILLSMASKVPPGAEGLLFLPYLLGERAPVWDADAKGVLTGLTMKHRKEHMVRAALEGICFTLFQIIRELEAVYGTVSEIYASGGFVKSSFWVQLIADITGKKVRLSEMTDASAMGAAYLSMYATGSLKELAAVRQFMSSGKVYTPCEISHRAYTERFEFFNLLYPKFKDNFAALGRLQEN
jgi:gluconokinase